jgi:catalase
MARTIKAKGFEKFKDREKHLVAGPIDATHQTVDAALGSLTTNQGVVIADNKNTLSGVPSVFFDAVAIFASAEGIKPLLKNRAAIDWVRDAFGHLKVIGHTSAAQSLFAKAGLADDLDQGVIELDARASIGQYIETTRDRS